jgi:peroxiredoxin family protein
MQPDDSDAQFSLIQTKGTLDWLYPALILASTAAAMDKQVHLFFSFYGLQGLLKETNKLKVSHVGNPAMPLKLPVGPNWLKSQDLRVLPGMTSLATWAFKKTLQQNGQLPYDELRALCLELGVQMTACQMTVDLLGYDKDDFIEGVDFAGAATYFAHSPQSQSLFI